jgi:hypothetical protein
MLAALSLVVTMMAPATGAVPPQGPVPTRVEEIPVGPFEYVHTTELTWPGLHLPAFTLVPERRVVHTFSLRLRHDNLRWLSAQVVAIEPTQNPGKYLGGLNGITLEGRYYMWLGGQAQLPNGAKIKFGRSLVAAAGRLLPGVSSSDPPRLSVVFPEGFFTRRWR